MRRPKRTCKNFGDIESVKSRLNKNRIINKENRSDDEIVANSQENSESKLKKKIMENMLKKSGPLSPISQKDVFIDSSQKAVSSIEANNGINVESIERTRNLNGLRIKAFQLSNISKYSSPMSNCNTKSEEKQVKDPSDFSKKYDKLNEILDTHEERTVINDKPNVKNFLSSNDNCDNKKNLKPEPILDKLSEECIKKLKTLKIKLQHEVPIQHKIERHAGSRALSQRELKAFKRYSVLKKGVFNKEENNTLKQNWKSFCEIHNWKKNDVKPFLNLSHNGKCYLNLEERKNFVRFLANGLPSRSLNSVYFRFRNLFDGEVNTGKFTCKEDSMIMKYLYSTSGSKSMYSSAYVAKILNRKRDTIRRRFRILIKKYNLKDEVYNTNDSSSDEYENSQINVKRTKAKNTLRNSVCANVDTNVSWTYPMVQKFIDTLTETSGCELEELKNVVIDQSVWDKIGKNLNIDQKILKNFWYFQLHMQIFCPKPIYLSELKISLIEYIYKKGDVTLENLMRENACSQFDGVTLLFLSKLFKQLVEYTKTKINSSALKDIVQYLYHEYIPKVEEKSFDSILPKLYLKNNRLIEVDKGKEKKLPHKNKANVFSDEDT